MINIFKKRFNANGYDDMLTSQLRMVAAYMEVTRPVYERCELVVEALCQGIKSKESLEAYVNAGIEEGRFNHLYE